MKRDTKQSARNFKRFLAFMLTLVLTLGLACFTVGAEEELPLTDDPVIEDPEDELEDLGEEPQGSVPVVRTNASAPRAPEPPAAVTDVFELTIDGSNFYAVLPSNDGGLTGYNVNVAGGAEETITLETTEEVAWTVNGGTGVSDLSTEDPAEDATIKITPNELPVSEGTWQLKAVSDGKTFYVRFQSITRVEFEIDNDGNGTVKLADSEDCSATGDEAAIGAAWSGDNFGVGVVPAGKAWMVNRTGKYSTPTQYDKRFRIAVKPEEGYHVEEFKITKGKSKVAVASITDAKLAADGTYMYILVGSGENIGTDSQENIPSDVYNVTVTFSADTDDSVKVSSASLSATKRSAAGFLDGYGLVGGDSQGWFETVGTAEEDNEETLAGWDTIKKAASTNVTIDYRAGASDTVRPVLAFKLAECPSSIDPDTVGLLVYDTPPEDNSWVGRVFNVLDNVAFVNTGGDLEDPTTYDAVSADGYTGYWGPIGGRVIKAGFSGYALPADKTFYFFAEQNGTYKVEVALIDVADSGAELDKKTITFTVKKSSSSGGGGGGGGVTTEPTTEPKTQEQKQDQLAADNQAEIEKQIGEDKPVTLNLSETGNTVLLNQDTVEMLIESGQPLIITKGDAIITLSPDVLEGLGEEGGIKIVIIPNPEPKEGEEKLGLTGGYDVKVFNGSNDEIQGFSGLIVIEFDMSGQTLTEEQIGKLSAIRILKDGRRQRIGGTYDRSKKKFRVSTDHFSVYYVDAVENLVKLALSIGSNSYSVNGDTKNTDVAPVIVGSRTMVPVRFIAEGLGADVGWEGGTKTVSIALDGKYLSFKIGEMAPGMDVPAQIMNGRTVVPLRYVSEQLGAFVAYDPATKSISIVK